MSNEPISEQISAYYTRTLAKHGATALGVDWNGSEGQLIRFKQFDGLLPTDSSFSVTDLGCGYGAYLAYLESTKRDFDYLGVDLSPKMIETANDLWQDRLSARFLRAATPDKIQDYCVASGILSVKLAVPVHAWRAHFEETIDVLNGKSSLGFAFNCLTSYSDPERMKDHLYYADPCEVFDLCKRKYSRNVALLHDYGLYEFTVLVRKTLP